MKPLLQELDRAIERGWANGGHLAAIRDLALEAANEPEGHAPQAPPAAVPAVHVFNCHRCPVSVEARWQPPECPECGDPCVLDTSAKPAPVAAQKGYTLVPVEPTEAMLDAAWLQVLKKTSLLDWNDALDVWNAMLAAAPEVPRG